MFQFSIREILMAILVLGIGLGWLVNRQQWVAENHHQQSLTTEYQQAAGTLEKILKLEGYVVEWGDWYEVRVTAPDKRVRQLKTWVFAPSDPVYHVTD